MIDVVFLDAGGVLVTPDPELVLRRFAAVGIAIEDPGLVFAAHYHGVRAIDDARAEPEVFDDYHLAYARHLGIGALDTDLDDVGVGDVADEHRVDLVGPGGEGSPREPGLLGVAVRAAQGSCVRAGARGRSGL